MQLHILARPLVIFCWFSAALALSGESDNDQSLQKDATALCPAQQFRVRLDNPAQVPLVERTFAILKDRLEARTGLQVLGVEAHAQLILGIDSALAEEAYRVDEAEGAIRVSGGSPRGLLYGVGKFLHSSSYGSEFQPTRWRGTAQPRGSLRGIYFATHFHNWYHVASDAEVARYMEDLALWGMNAVKAVLPMITLHGWEDPEAGPALAMLRRYARTAHELDLMFFTGMGNALFMGAPSEIRAKPLPDPLGRRGNSGYPVCPSNPAGHAYLMENMRQLCLRFQDIGIDGVSFWPYDEGGCPCEQCRPWGSNGHLKLARDMTAVGRQYFPKMKVVLSTWGFDTPPEGEWPGLMEALSPGREPWLDYILADAHEDFPRYPLENGVPGARALLNFPEISMWGNSPWGGIGANPLPARLQRLWSQVRHVVKGGFPYSEGIYEDMNKVVELQFYWDAQRTAWETLGEYSRYEYGAGTAETVLQLVDALEAAASRSFRQQAVDPETARATWKVASSLDAGMPSWARKGWRWRVLLLRSLLDQERFGTGNLEGAQAQAAMRELAEIYHCPAVTDDPYHARVRPPLSESNYHPKPH